MSIENYNNSLFYQFLDVNDHTLEDLAYNLYYKLKNRGVLPESIVRDREVGVDLVASNDSEDIDISTDKDFTFSSCLNLSVVNSELLLSDSDNILNNYSIQFEFKPTSTPFQFNLFGGLIQVTNLGVQLPNATFFSKVFIVDGFHKVKIERSRLNLDIYINDELLNQQTLTLDETFEISNYLIKLIGGSVKVGNVKITSGDLILHWWKLNNKR